MKTTLFLFAFVTALLSVTNVEAQNYNDLEDNLGDLVIYVKYVGQKPGIVDFATAYLNEIKDEEVGSNPYQDWQRYLKHRRLSSHASFIVDKKNGYIKYTKKYPADNDMSYLEMCYWNCADGKHKLFAVNCGYLQNGEEIWTEYTGVTFFMYDNAKKKMTLVYPEYLNALFDGEGSVTFCLPRVGKDLKVRLTTIDEVQNYTLKWNGYTF